MTDFDHFSEFDGPEQVASRPSQTDAQPAPVSVTPAPVKPVQNDEDDPFKDFTDNSMQPAPAPTAWESFKENFSHGVGGITKQASETIDRVKAKSTVERGREQGIAGPGEVMSPKPSQAEFDKALGDLAAQQAERERWDSFHSEGVGGKAAAVLGAGIGGLLDPINLLPIARVGAAFETAGAAVGLNEIAANIAARAGEFGAFTAAADAASQGLDIKAGYQQGFDYQRLALSTALGMGLGGSMAGAATFIKGLRGELPGQADRVLEGMAKPIPARAPMVEPGKVGEPPVISEAGIPAPVKPDVVVHVPMGETPPAAIGSAEPQARLASQPAPGPQSVTARMSADAIKSDLGVEVPGTLIRGGAFGVPEQEGITAFHGTPHDFERFDSSKIGTGEGAQAYGHGLYFAEKEGIAKGYQEKLAKKNQRQAIISDSTFGNVPILETDPTKPGALYQVHIKADPAKFLDWDKPLEQQKWIWDKLPEDLKAAIDDAMDARGVTPMSEVLEEYTGKDLYRALIHHDVHESIPGELPGSSWFTGDTNEKIHTAKFLESLGVDGIKYLDNGSRKTGEGTNNFVVFDDSKVNIVSKNGKIQGLNEGLRSEAKARFADELRSAGVNARNFDPDLTARAEAKDTHDLAAAHEQAAIERAYEQPETRDIARKVYGRFKVKEPPAESAPSLNSFLRANGGIQDSGDISRIFGRGSNHNKGNGRLITKDGMKLDDALEAAVEAGYFPGHRDRSNLSVADLLDAIKEDADGRKVYPEGMSKAEIADRRAYERQTNEMDAAEMHVRDVVKFGEEYEPPPAEVWRDAAAHMVFGGEKDPHRAFDRAVLDYERTQGEHEALIRAAHGNGEADRGAIRSRAGYDEEGRIAGPSQELSGAGATGEASRVGNAERTADGKLRADRYPVGLDPDKPTSWIVRDKETGKVVREIDDPSLLDHVNTYKYEAVPALQHLQEYNAAVKAAGGHEPPPGWNRKLATEAGAEGKPQTLIPGVEPVTDRQRLDLEAGKPLRGGNEPMNDGLFNPEAGNQGEMFLNSGGKGPRGPNAADRRFSNREQLPGEAETKIGPTPAVVDAEARDHRLNEAMKEIAARMGRRLEMDGRMSKGALGTYKPADGVLRVKYAGDIETFTHELGHAIDQALSSDLQTKAVWKALRTAKPSELLALDYNAGVTGGKATVEEGVAEFLRTYVTNPAYAQAQAPLTADAFRAILAKKPDIAGILSDVAKLSQIESGLNPKQVFASMIAPGHRSGFAKLSRDLSKHGIVPTMKDYAATIYGGLIRESVHFDRLTQFLRDMRFEKTGTPIKDLEFKTDPDHLFRQLPGAKQSAIGIVDRGVPLDATDPFNSARSPSITQAVARALNGSFSRLENDLDPLVVDLNAYLVARRAKGEWELFKAGKLRNQPVRASENETLKAISDFEAQYPQFKQAADDIFSFQRAFLQRKVDKGLISKETADAFLATRQDHVPLYRDFGDELAGGGSGGGGGFKSLQYSDTKRFGGSTRDVKNVLRSMIEDVSRAERRIAENDVLVAIDDLARQAGEFAGPVWEHIPNHDLKANTVDIAEAITAAAKAQGLSKPEIDMMISDLAPMVGEDMSATVFKREPTAPKGQRVLFFYRGGERQAVKLGDNEISKHFYNLMTAMSEPEKDIFFKTIGAINSAFQASITHAPRFLLGTYVRDNMTRMFIPRFMGVAGRIPMAQDIAGVYTMIADRAFYRAYMEGGGIRGGVYSHAANELGHDALKGAADSSGFLTRTLNELAEADTLGKKAGVLSEIPGRMAQSAGDYIGALGRRVKYAEGGLAKGWAVLSTPAKMVSDALRLVEMSETASRVGGAKLTYKYLKKQGLSDVEAFNGALYESRDVLNYQSHGEWLTRFSRVAPFLNAGITGADRSARGLIAEPVMAAMRAYERGGYAKLDAKDKAILSAAWKNWLYIGAAAGVTASVYYPYASQTQFYQRASEYMKKTYFLIQTGEDSNGNPVGLTIHKGYDVPAALITSMEMLADEARKHSPTNWGRVMHGLMEAVPRQFRTVSGLLEASPVIKTAYEVKTGMRLGMEGGPASPIVPDALKGSIERQVTATTSWMAKKIAGMTGASPLVVDHVLGSAGTSAQDIKDLASAVFDNNPLATKEDAMNRFFFGQIYRTAKNDVSAGHDIRDLMARDHGSYQTQANAYRAALEEGNSEEAQSIYNRGDDTSKALMTLQASYKFKPEDRQLHPLQRSSDIAGVMYGMMRNLGKSEIAVQDRSRKRGEEKETILLSPEQARQLHAQFNAIMSEETRNGLTMAGQPGYEDFPIIDTKPRMEMIRQIDPDSADELEKRLKSKHILPAQGVAAVWPEVKRRLLTDGRAARIHELTIKAKQPQP